MYYRLFTGYSSERHGDIHGRVTCPEDVIFQNHHDFIGDENPGWRSLIWRRIKNPLYRHSRVMNILRTIGQYHKIKNARENISGYLNRICEFIAEQDAKHFHSVDKGEYFSN